MRIFCLIKITYLNCVDLHSNAFLKIWQLSLLLCSLFLPAPLPPPIPSSPSPLFFSPGPPLIVFVVGKFVLNLYNLKSAKYSKDLLMAFLIEYHKTKNQLRIDFALHFTCSHCRDMKKGWKKKDEKNPKR